MNDIQYSPAPWHASRKSVFINDRNNTVIAEMALNRTHRTTDAALLAAAPALLAALQGMVDMYAELINSGDAGFWDPEKVDEVKHARAALAAAKGEA